MKKLFDNTWFAFVILIMLFIMLTSGTQSMIKSITYEPLPIPTSIPTFQSTSIPTFTPTPTPMATETPLANIEYPLGDPLDFIPAPFYYSCRMTLEKYCINEGTAPERTIAIVIYDEAGTLSLQVAVDMLQVLDNTMRNAWECWSLETRCSDNWKTLNPYHITYEDISVEMRQALAMFILSSPYNLGSHIPAWNAWAVPFPEKSVESLSYSRRQFGVIEQMVIEWLLTSVVEIDQVWPDFATFITDIYKLWPAEILAEDQRIMYFYGTEEYDEHLASEAAYVSKLPNGHGYIYYSSYGHTP